MAEATTAVENKPAAGNQTPTARTDRTKMQWTLHQMKINKIGYIFVAPFFILFLVFVAWPVLLSFVLSFTSFNMLQFPRFLFLDNYIRMFLDDDLVLAGLQNTLIFAAITGPVSYIASLMLAWFINELSAKIRTVVTVLYYAPTICGAMYVIWLYFFSSDQYGFANQILMYLHVINTPILWFANAKYAVT
ncbi:MAG: hypothetical protein FWF28_04670, partial [Micrococcales bacterium]|nr:hypothetical protein [Micrococcales bacterium]